MQYKIENARVLNGPKKTSDAFPVFFHTATFLNHIDKCIHLIQQTVHTKDQYYMEFYSLSFDRVDARHTLKNCPGSQNNLARQIWMRLSQINSIFQNTFDQLLKIRLVLMSQGHIFFFRNGNIFPVFFSYSKVFYHRIYS